MFNSNMIGSTIVDAANNTKSMTHAVVLTIIGVVALVFIGTTAYKAKTNNEKLPWVKMLTQLLFFVVLGIAANYFTKPDIGNSLEPTTKSILDTVNNTVQDIVN